MGLVVRATIPYSYADFFSHGRREFGRLWPLPTVCHTLESTCYFHNALGARLLKLVDFRLGPLSFRHCGGMTGALPRVLSRRILRETTATNSSTAVFHGRPKWP